MHLKPRLAQQGAGDALKCNPRSGEQKKERTPILLNCMQATPAKTLQIPWKCVQELREPGTLEDTAGRLHCDCSLAARAARRLPEGGSIGEPLTALFSRCSLSTYDVPDAALYTKGAARKEILTRFSAYVELAS